MDDARKESDEEEREGEQKNGRMEVWGCGRQGEGETRSGREELLIANCQNPASSIAILITH